MNNKFNKTYNAAVNLKKKESTSRSPLVAQSERQSLNTKVVLEFKKTRKLDKSPVAEEGDLKSLSSFKNSS
jgi:hypothetical protein